MSRRSGVARAALVMLSMTTAFGACGTDDADESRASDSGTQLDSGPPFLNGACAQCTHGACSTELAACKGESQCAAWIGCVDACPMAASGNVDATCEAGCVDAVSGLAESVQADLEDCFATAACAACSGTSADAGDAADDAHQVCPATSESDPCFACWDDNCCESEAACADSTDCQDVRDCFAACPDGGGETCEAACFSDNPKGAKEFVARLVCRMSFCATGETCFEPDDPGLEKIACENEHCQALRNACWLVPECYLITICAGACSGSSTCIESCKNAYPADAKKLFEDWNVCSLAQCI